MFPLLPFAVGLLTGAAAIKLIKTDKSKTTLDKVQSGLRNATVSSLAAIENSSANLRNKLMHRPAPAAQFGEPAGEASPQPAPKPVRRKTAAKSTPNATPRVRRRKTEEGAS